MTEPVKQFDIQREIVSLASHLYQEMGFPRRLFEEEPKCAAHSKFLFPCVEPEDLYFNPFYGDSWVSTLTKSSRRMVVKRKVRRRSPDDVSIEVMRNSIAECLDSVEEDDKEVATLKLIIGKVHFESHKGISVDKEKQFFKGKAHADQFFVHLPNNRLFFFHQICEWANPTKALNFLEENGFSITSREDLDPEVLLGLQRGFLRKKIGDDKYLFFDNALKLNPATLAIESWRIQNLFPMSYYIMHGFPTSYDVILRTNIRRYVKFTDLFALNGGTTPGLTFVDEGSEGFIHRTDVGFKLLNQYDKLKCITESCGGERIHLQHNNVSCFMNLAPIKYFHFDSIRNEFSLLEDQCSEAVLEFPLSGNREELIEVIARLSHKLFSTTNDDDQLPMETPPSFINEFDGTRVSAQCVQAIIRLHREHGDLYHLLALGDSSNLKECQQKARNLESLLLQNCKREWFKKMELDFDELMEKLTSACLAYNINL